MRITALASERLSRRHATRTWSAPTTTAIVALRDLGARIDEASFPFDFDDVMVKNGRIIAAEAYAIHRTYIEDEALDIDPWVRRRVLGGKSIIAADYIDDLAARKRAAAAFADWMREHDALLTPTLPITATPVADVDEATTPLATWTRAANYLGGVRAFAAGRILRAGPADRRAAMGARFGEATLIRIGRAFQKVTDWHRRRPPI